MVEQLKKFDETVIPVKKAEALKMFRYRWKMFFICIRFFKTWNNKSKNFCTQIIVNS